ncbi:MAG: hypothetical protein ACI9KE_001476 [Polyangiales bacterium]|jgi:hypothetical protein
MFRWITLCLVLAACSDDDVSLDGGGVPDAPIADAATSDAATSDAPTSDRGGEDAGTTNERFFPEAAWMYQEVTDAPTRADSAAITTWLEENGGWGLGRMQIDYSIEVLESGGAAPRPFEPTGDFFSPDCDSEDVPVPAVGALEGEEGYACESDGDCHLIVVDREGARLYEMWRADIRGDTFNGGCLAVWDMDRTYGPDARGEQCTSADAAGFPIAPLLLYPEEVAAGEVAHAIRFILPNARMRADTYTRPATHAGGPNAEGPAPVYGGRWRLRADFDMSSLPNDAARTVARAMQRYGMALADGGNVALTAASDRFRETKWEGLLGPRDLAVIQPSDFDVIDTGADIELTFDCVRVP